ncbi:hypothetical protein Syun_007495 [Stephania yunnanensis]|uniref:Uncharacterized protein n=1 Tax=Stephania yunnanensis TaxID=152371 RepID=A0AAP0Q0B8_9MAGN
MTWPQRDPIAPSQKALLGLGYPRGPIAPSEKALLMPHGQNQIRFVHVEPRGNSAFSEGAIPCCPLIHGDAAPRKGGDGVEQGGERPEEKRDAAEKEGVRAAVRGGEGGERRLWAHRDQNKGCGTWSEQMQRRTQHRREEGAKQEEGGPAA